MLVREQAQALAEQQRQLDARVRELEGLTQRLEAMEQQQGITAEPSEPLPVAVATEEASEPGRSMEIYGFAQLDAIQDLDRVDPNWKDGFRPSKIPTTEGAFGGDGQSSLSVKQSRFGVQGTVPTGGERESLDYKFEFDLFGVGADEGQTTFRLRHAYGRWGPVLAGQTHSLFMDINVFPNTIDYWGPSGMVFLRNPQLRWTPWSDGSSHAALAIEKPGNDIDPGQIREFDPQLGENLQGDNEVPDFTARWRTAGDWGHFQTAGILRRVGFETRGTPGNEPSGDETGWGINLSTNINVFDRDRVVGQVVYGEGIASYMNDGGTDLAPGDSGAETVPLTGVVAYYDHYWNDRWSSAIGYSFTEVDNTSLQTGDAFHKGEYASVNLLYFPGANLLFGGELLWGQRTDDNGASGEDTRFQFSAKYNFGINP